MAKDASELLGFMWKERFYSFTVLPFGLCTGPAVFTKVFRILIKKWRAEGINVAMYLDDGLIWASSKNECLTASHRIRQDLQNAGSQVSEEKCQWNPVFELTWLGYVINLENYYIKPTPERRAILHFYFGIKKTKQKTLVFT